MIIIELERPIHHIVLMLHKLFYSGIDAENAGKENRAAPDKYTLHCPERKRTER